MSRPLRVLLLEESHDDSQLTLSRLADFVEMSDDAIIGESVRGVITSWNAGALRLFGYKAEEVLGRPGSLLADHEHADESRRMLEQIGRGERIEHFETVRRRKDGSEIAISLSISPIRDACGLVIGASKIARDLTAQKRAEHEMTRLKLELHDRVGDLHALLEILPISVWIGDATAERIIGNRAAYEMAGLPVGTNLSLTAPEVRAGATAGYRCFRDGNEVPPDELPMQVVARTGLDLKNFEQDLVFDDGRVVSIQGSVAPLFDDQGKVRGVVCACVDISARRQAEEELRAANRRKDQFLAALSHELRTPLTPVLMSVSAMLDSPPAVDELRTNLAMIRDNVELEASLIDHLLDVTRITLGKLHLNRDLVDVHTLIFRALETCRDVIQNGKDRGATFTLELPARTEKVPEPPTTPLILSDTFLPQPLKLLLVEDNKDSLRCLALAMVQRRHTVRTAVDLASARDLVASEVFDLLISDLDLPDGSGLDLMHEISATRSFPGIAISGFGSDEDVRMSKEAGFAVHLTKPIDLQTLEATMRRVVAVAPVSSPLE